MNTREIEWEETTVIIIPEDEFKTKNTRAVNKNNILKVKKINPEINRN